MNTGSTFAIILVLFILLVIVGYGGWFTGVGLQIRYINRGAKMLPFLYNKKTIYL